LVSTVTERKSGGRKEREGEKPLLQKKKLDLEGKAVSGYLGKEGKAAPNGPMRTVFSLSREGGLLGGRRMEEVGGVEPFATLNRGREKP